MNAVEFIAFLNEGLTPEQEEIFEYVKTERRTTELYRETARRLAEQVRDLEKRSGSGGDVQIWATRCAAAIATPAVLRSLADFVGPVPNYEQRWIDIIKRIRALTGLGLLESKLAADFLMKHGFSSQSIITPTDSNDFRNFFEQMYVGLEKMYVATKGIK